MRPPSYVARRGRAGGRHRPAGLDEERSVALSNRRSALVLTCVVAVVSASRAFLVTRSRRRFLRRGQALWVLLPGVVAYAPVTVLVVYLSVRRGRPRLSLAVSVVALLVTTAAAFAFIPALGTTGAALASTLGYVAGGALAWVFFVRLSRSA